jgi:hypothetical protein
MPQERRKCVLCLEDVIIGTNMDYDRMGIKITSSYMFMIHVYDEWLKTGTGCPQVSIREVKVDTGEYILGYP